MHAGDATAETKKITRPFNAFAVFGKDKLPRRLVCGGGSQVLQASSIARIWCFE